MSALICKCGYPKEALRHVKGRCTFQAAEPETPPAFRKWDLVRYTRKNLRHCAHGPTGIVREITDDGYLWTLDPKTGRKYQGASHSSEYALVSRPLYPELGEVALALSPDDLHALFASLTETFTEADRARVRAMLDRAAESRVP